MTIFSNILGNCSFRVSGINNLRYFYITAFNQIFFTQSITLHAKYNTNAETKKANYGTQQFILTS